MIGIAAIRCRIIGEKMSNAIILIMILIDNTHSDKPKQKARTVLDYFFIVRVVYYYIYNHITEIIVASCINNLPYMVLTIQSVRVWGI